MGQTLQSNLHACCDPEGVQRIVREKKQLRAALETYQGLFEAMERALESNDAHQLHDLLQKVETQDRQCKEKWNGRFWTDLNAHRDYPPVAQKRQAVEARARAMDGGNLAK